MLVRDLGLVIPSVSFQKCIQWYLFLYWFQEALAATRLLFWHECFSWIFSRCLFEHRCIVEKSNRQRSRQREWLQSLTRCHGLALLSQQLCLDIWSQRCHCSQERRTLLPPLSKSLTHIQKIRITVLETGGKKCRLLNLEGGEKNKPKPTQKTPTKRNLQKTTEVFFSHFILSGDGL